MRRKSKIVVLFFLAITLLLWASLETFHLYSAFHHLKIPDSETRQPYGQKVHGWMSVEELAKCYQVPPTEIFTALNVEPEAGDEHLSLRHLAEKYDISSTEMEEVLNRFTEPGPTLPRPGGR